MLGLTASLILDGHGAPHSAGRGGPRPLPGEA